jgi:hypothetical protein
MMGRQTCVSFTPSATVMVYKVQLYLGALSVDSIADDAKALFLQATVFSRRVFPKSRSKYLSLVQHS